jgi:release factor glutamine methyltransferase
MTSFFHNARQYLTGSGRMLISFGTSGDLCYLRTLAADAGFTTEIVAQRDLVKDDWHVRYFTFRMTPGPDRACQS